jgi:hypothetical protein
MEEEMKFEDVPVGGEFGFDGEEYDKASSFGAYPNREEIPFEPDTEVSYTPAEPEKPKGYGEAYEMYRLPPKPEKGCGSCRYWSPDGCEKPRDAEREFCSSVTGFSHWQPRSPLQEVVQNPTSYSEEKSCGNCLHRKCSYVGGSEQCVKNGYAGWQIMERVTISGGGTSGDKPSLWTKVWRMSKNLFDTMEDARPAGGFKECEPDGISSMKVARLEGMLEGFKRENACLRETIGYLKEVLKHGGYSGQQRFDDSREGTAEEKPVRDPEEGDGD